VSLGLWQNFGGERSIETQRAIIRRAFDLGITHFDLANNYGPPYGSAEESFGHVLRSDLSGHRDELVISTKAGYDMWPGSVAQLEQSVGALDKLQFSAEELKDIDRYATESGINLWAASSAG
jgi:aryl-alcohol dehydrogenase-like predicted oxidoreductase